MMSLGLWAILHLAALAPADTLVICSREWQPELAPWLAHRRAQGHVIQVVEPVESFAAQQAVVRAANRIGALKNVLLVGDGPATGVAKSNLIPVELSPAQINVRYGSEPTLATDFGFSDVDGDREPDLCVGRLPVRSRQELSQVIRKIIAYETDCRGADWRRRVNIVAGTGNFSMLADRAIEVTAARLISDMVPGDRKVHLTYGSWRSPFCPPPRLFSQHTLARLNEGCGIWVYVGHGLPDQLDQVQIEDARFPILTDSDVGRLNCTTGQPIAVLLACYTGAFDGARPSISERFVLQPGGPVAVLAASRVSMPYGNTVFGAELMRAVFVDRAATVGDVVRRAKSRLVASTSNDTHRSMIENVAKVFTPTEADRDQERWEHAQMYNLLGDPLLRIGHPTALQLAAPTQASAGGRLQVSGTAPEAGTLRLEWTAPLERQMSSTAARRSPSFDPRLEKEQAERYYAANNSVLSATEIDVDAGTFTVDVVVPELMPDEYVMRAFLAAPASWASASANVEITDSKVAQRPRATN